MTKLSTRCGGRRAKSAKSRNHRKWGAGGAGAAEIQQVLATGWRPPFGMRQGLRLAMAEVCRGRSALEQRLRNAAGNTAAWLLTHLHDAENYPVFLNNASMKMTWPSPAMNCSIAPAKR